MNKSMLSCRIDLPADFRRKELLDFHGRDTSMLAERVDKDFVEKGLAWYGIPACLSLHFHARYVVAKLSIDGPSDARHRKILKRMVVRMLGLTQSTEAFEEHYRNHPLLGGLIQRRPGLRVPLTATPFEALCWAIIGQQISLGAAISIRRRFIETVGIRHSSGLRCFPDAGRVASLTGDAMRLAGLSRTKAGALTALSIEVEQGLPLEDWAETLPVEEIRTQLTQIRGIGPWTVEYALLRGFGFLDGSLHGDVAVRRKLQNLLNAREAVTPSAAQRWLADFSPWRALVAAHLWATDSAPQ